MSEASGEPRERDQAAGGQADASGEESGPRNPRGTGPEHTERLAELLRAVEDAEEVVVITHDNPDPDAIASAGALGFLLERTAGVEVTLAFGGIVGRAENRALIEELGVQFQRIGKLDLSPAALVALVDTQPRTGNNSLPEGRIAGVVIDHHPLRSETTACPFYDVRPDYGASCSILVEYLRGARIEPERRLATALFYGIQSETMDLGREVSAADESASLFLYPRCDPAAVSRIRHARVPAGYFRSMHGALESAHRFDGVICAPVGRLDYPDMVAELADLFMRVDGVEWTVAAGLYHDDLLLSVRTYETGAHAGDLVRRVVRERGSAGGHGMLAGAQIPIGTLSDGEIQELVDEVFREFRVELGVEEEPAEPIIPPEEQGVGGISEEAAADGAAPSEESAGPVEGP